MRAIPSKTIMRRLQIGALSILAMIEVGCQSGSGPFEGFELARVYPITGKTKSGLERISFYYQGIDEPYLMESHPICVTYFDESTAYVQPLKQIRIGMTKDEVINVLGEPLIDKDNFMLFRIETDSVFISHDDAQLITSIEIPHD